MKKIPLVLLLTLAITLISILPASAQEPDIFRGDTLSSPTAVQFQAVVVQKHTRTPKPTATPSPTPLPTVTVTPGVWMPPLFDQYDNKQDMMDLRLTTQ